MRPSPTFVKRKRRGFSITELLLVIAMVSVLAGFAVVSFVRDRAVYRTNIAVEIANYLQNARIDSMRRSAKDLNQMAQVKILNRKSYSVAIDADNDGVLDIPRVIKLPEQPEVQFEGPFPKTYTFDGQGQAVDPQNRRISPQ